jgi:CheY-like chemotaxis protein
VYASHRIEVANRSLRQAEQDIGTALDGFSRKLSDGDLPGLVEIKDRTRFQQEIDRLKMDEIEKRFQSVTAAVQPMQRWVEDLRQDVAPHMESARLLKAMAERVRPSILLVDDDPFQHKLLGQILEQENMDLVCVESGAAALGVLRRRRPDLILMDVMMPDIDGIEVTRRLKATEPYASIPVVMITGQGEKNTVVASQKAGAVDFVVKPFSRDTLVAKLHKYLKGGVGGLGTGP